MLEEKWVKGNRIFVRVKLINADLDLVTKLICFMVMFLKLSREIYGNVKLWFAITRLRYFQNLFELVD